ncbi:MAG TPA: heparinase II/III family protein, partial [Myxococcota bacterium]|nr:heparinase II/III family protein [Myxococcota bacterium]
AVNGRILCFGRVVREFGAPLDWHLDPHTGRRWPRVHWSRTFFEGKGLGDIKLAWEPGRFPQAYDMARTGAVHPEAAPALAEALAGQIAHFVAANPRPIGIHWHSGQEIAVRLMAWLFGLDTLLSRQAPMLAAARVVGDALAEAAEHVEQYIVYARVAVYNNHLTAEALLLMAAGILLPHHPSAVRWRDHGRRLLIHCAQRQIDADGSFINQSHTYHRVALHYLVWSVLLARAAGDSVPTAWLAAMERSLPLLLAHQNPADGRLPNFGANDGAQPNKWTSCDYTDFRPILQLVSVLARGERLYAPGPWDEAVAWCLGPLALDAPLHEPSRTSVSFPVAGYHVLRGRDSGTFVTLRCGDVRERFGQIDMLHLDAWWQGHNVLVDGGSYLYGGEPGWHGHFLGTASHNT